MNLNNKIALVLEIQELSIRITNNSDVDVFAEFLGHTNGMYIRVFLNGWSSDQLQPDFIKSIYLDWDCVNDLNDIIKYLRIIEREIEI